MAEYERLTSAPAGGISTMLNRFLEAAAARTKPRTMEQYRIAAAKIEKAFVEFSPSQVKPTHIAQFMDHFRSTPNMANRMRSVLKMAFDKAVLLGDCDSNPVTSVPRHAEAKRTRYITDAEYAAVKACASPVFAAIMDVAYYTGQRIGDILAIRLSDISDDGICFEQEKTGARLLVRMTPELKTAVETAKTARGSNVRAMTLFFTRKGTPYAYRTVKDMLERASVRAKVDNFNLHDIRAKSITDAEKQGKDPQALAGHTSRAMTERYLRDRKTPIVEGPSFGRVQKDGQKNKRK
ncbi:MAG: tyrosine-type recombinase/integrase [Betaproteobacteria bacterium]|nr:tyrosine-type recombinase/integrase [Betaproteobacteria bacterium]